MPFHRTLEHVELSGDMPSHDTFGRVFSLINPKELEK